MLGGVVDGGSQDSKADEGFKELVSVMVSLSCSPAHVSKPKEKGKIPGLGHLGLKFKLNLAVSNMFPFTTNTSQ